ncbi:hypothetical protein QOZ80_2BG0181890 [Eleusine coracana subsp. coracana]|nr:hypothetical protein QOZ80_2BG0181890 [Eleusine coracana subsp. coracana]
MRIRKRTPVRAASPGPSPPLSPSRTGERSRRREEEVSREEDDDDSAEEILVAGAGDQEDGLVLAASKISTATDDVSKPEPRDDAAGRCSRNDGKRWRCKNAAVPGFLFCDRHVAWSVRQRQPRTNNKRKQSKKHSAGGVLEPLVPVEEEEEEAEDKSMDDDDGFQPGGRKRARGGSVNMNQQS